MSSWQPTPPDGQPRHDPWAASQALGQEPYPSPQPYGRPPQHHRRPAGRPGRWKLGATVAGGIAALLIVISVVAQGGKGTPSGGPSPTASIAAHETSTASKSPAPTAARKTTAAATSEAAAPPSPSPSSPVARTTPAAAPSQSPATAASCQPLSSTGHCYQAGESCPAADHNQSGVDGNGNAIICKNNHGWRWEPA